MLEKYSVMQEIFLKNSQPSTFLKENDFNYSFKDTVKVQVWVFQNILISLACTIIKLTGY